MNDAELFYIVNNYKYTVLTGITVIILGFIIKFAIKIYKTEQLKNKKIVHYTEYKVSYIGTNGFPTSRTWTYKNSTIEECREMEKKIREFNSSIYKRYNEISDKDLINVDNIVLIPKEKFISIETDTYIRHE